MNNYQALKLDASYRPIGVVSSIDALVSSMMGKSRILETHNKTIRSPSVHFKLPSVIVIDRIAKHRKTFTCDKNNVYLRDNGLCQYCGCSVEKSKVTLDHVIPKSHGGKLSWDNIVLCCRSCNQKKGNRTPLQAGMKLFKEPKVLTYHEYLGSLNLDNTIWKDYI